MRQFREFETGPDDEDRRLDRLARRFLPGASLSAIYRALRTGSIRIDGKKAEPSTRVTPRARLQIEVDLLELGRGGGENDLVPSKLAVPPPKDVAILLETKNLLFVSKPRGVLSHGENGLDSFVLTRYPSSHSLAFVPAPLHRLDRNTTGIVVCSRTLEGARAFSALLRHGGVSKRYLALLDGELKGSGAWNDSIERDKDIRKSRILVPGEAETQEGARQAVTVYESLAFAGGKTLALLTLETGRTHQIRTQATAHGHPLSGDLKYGGTGLPQGYILHAWALGFTEPPFEDVPSVVVAPLPEGTLEMLVRHFGEGIVHRLAGLN
jgi:23S rRNA pseudouridine955/2504/2580 synthase